MGITPYIHFAKQVLLSNYKRLHFPYKLTYCVTFRCNYSCQTCNIWKKQPQNELRIDEIKTFFSKSNQLLWVDLTGGEVTLRKDFVEICKVVIESCQNLLLLHFPTNGYLTETIIRIVREILKMKVKKLIITVSTDGDQETNDRIRGIEGGWEKQIETFRKLREIQGVETILGMTLSEANVNNFPKAFEAVKKECPWLRYNDYHINIAHESEHFYGNPGQCNISEDTRLQIINSVNKYIHLRRYSLKPVSLLEKAYLKHIPYFMKTFKSPMHCHALNASCFIDPSGNVFPCSIYNRKLGNLREAEYDLSTIWNNKKTKALQKDIWYYKCPQCWTPCEAYQSILGNILKIDKRN